MYIRIYLSIYLLLEVIYALIMSFFLINKISYVWWNKPPTYDIAIFKLEIMFYKKKNHNKFYFKDLSLKEQKNHNTTVSQKNTSFNNF